MTRTDEREGDLSSFAQLVLEKLGFIREWGFAVAFETPLSLRFVRDTVSVDVSFEASSRSLVCLLSDGTDLASLETIAFVLRAPRSRGAGIASKLDWASGILRDLGEMRIFDGQGLADLFVATNRRNDQLNGAFFDDEVDDH